MIRLPRLLPALFTVLGASCGGYDPCEDKTCGDRCTVCEPGDNSCIETAEIKVCNAQFICVSASPPVCGST
jgi:hypothetical protein